MSAVYLIGKAEICQDPPTWSQDDQTLLSYFLLKQGRIFLLRLKIFLKLFIFTKKDTLKENKTFFVKKNRSFGIRENVSRTSFKSIWDLPWKLSVFFTDMKVLLCMKSNSEWSVYLRSRSSTWMGSEMIWSAAIMVISGLVRFMASLANGDILKPYTSDQ